MQKRYIALDFDGTICEHEFPEIGKLKSNVIIKLYNYLDMLRKRLNIEPVIILYTCRENMKERAYLTEAVDFCKLHDIPIKYVNENPEVNFGGRKMFADEYWDDRAFNPLREEK